MCYSVGMNRQDLVQHFRRELLPLFPQESNAECAVVRRACLVYVTWPIQPDQANGEQNKLSINVTEEAVDWYMSADSSRKRAFDAQLVEDIRKHLATDAVACIEHLIKAPIS
jgi:hypothetical protein